MPKTPEGGPAGPLDPTPEGADTGASAAPERRPGRPGADIRPGQGGDTRAPGASAGPGDSTPNGQAGTSNGQASASGPAGGGRTISERKKQFLIAPRHAEALAPMGFAPLSLSSVEQALRSSPDIDIVDTVGPRNIVGVLADGMGGGQGILVARMTEQKAGALHQQAQGRLLVERDQHLALIDVQYQPGFTSSVIPHGGPAFTATIRVLGKDGAPLADAEVSLFGSMLPATAVTDASGQVTLTLFGESASSVRSLYVKPKADYWSFYQRDPDISADELNVVGLRALSDWPQLAGLPGRKALGWGQKAMRLDQLPTTYRGQGIRIAIIDSGAATTHEELNRIRAGFDIVNKKTSPDTWNDDTLGHGTHCAGVIGGADLASGIRGFAPDAEIHVCKLFPGGQVSQLIDALEYCIEKQIDVVNLSLGGAEPSEALEQQIIRARRAGIACIVAAGNSGGPVQYPASSPHVLAVGAIGKLGEFPNDSYHAQTLSSNVDANGYFTASFSCFGPQIAVCAPGVAITSTVPPNNYAAWDGTSMAAPHVTGLAALVLAHHPAFQGAMSGRSADRVERLFQIIRHSAQGVTLADSTRIGLGMPDAVVATGLQAGGFAGMGAGVSSLLGQQMGSMAAMMQQGREQAGSAMQPMGGVIGGFLPQSMGMPLGTPLGMPLSMPLNMPMGMPLGMHLANFGRW